MAFNPFAKPKIPTLDTGALRRISDQNAQTQIDILGRKKQALQPLNAQFRTDRNALSAQVQPGAERLLSQYGQELGGVGAQEKAANEAASIANRQQNFRDVPFLQRSIRESLGSNGLLGSGAAASTIARPTLDAARASSDFSTGLNIEQLNNESRRAENLAGTGFDTRTAALSKRLGIDEGTLNELAASGRQDLLDEFASLAGVEDQRGANNLGIEQARQSSEQARAAASAARRGAVIGSLGSLVGAAAGSFGGPLGVGLGSQLGGTLGNLAGGGEGAPFDPTLLYALSQRPQNTRTAVTSSLGRVPTYPASSRMRG